MTFLECQAEKLKWPLLDALPLVDLLQKTTESDADHLQTHWHSEQVRSWFPAPVQAAGCWWFQLDSVSVRQEPSSLAMVYHYFHLCSIDFQVVNLHLSSCATLSDFDILLQITIGLCYYLLSRCCSYDISSFQQFEDLPSDKGSDRRLRWSSGLYFGWEMISLCGSLWGVCASCCLVLAWDRSPTMAQGWEPARCCGWTCVWHRFPSALVHVQPLHLLGVGAVWTHLYLFWLNWKACCFLCFAQNLEVHAYHETSSADSCGFPDALKIWHLCCCFGVPVNSFVQCWLLFCTTGQPTVPEKSLLRHSSCSLCLDWHSSSWCALSLDCSSSIYSLCLSKIVGASSFSLKMTDLGWVPMGYSCSCECRYQLFFVGGFKCCCSSGLLVGLDQSRRCLGLHLCIFGHVQCCFVISETRQALLPSEWTFSFYNWFWAVVITTRYCCQFSLIYCSPKSSCLA